jgi:hypothetical protein
MFRALSSAPLVALGLAFVAVACESHGPNPGGADPSASAAASVGAAATASAAPSAGPDVPVASAGSADATTYGAVRGTVRIKGDAAPTVESIAPKIPVGKCFSGHETYTKLFREGPGRTLADVLIAVTRYQGTPRKAPKEVRVEAKDCAYDRRTFAFELGQTLSIYNKGQETYTPQLMGFTGQALMLAIPGGDPVSFQPVKPGQYQLIDRTHSFIFGDVFVLDYPTVGVTGLDGKFEITGVPTGKAKLSALLPITGQTLERDIEVPASGDVQLELEFTFDAERDGAKARAAATN